jgi:hypothetical protein
VPQQSSKSTLISIVLPLISSSAQVGFVRSFGKYLLENENIAMNVVCPNKIRTSINTGGAFDKVEAGGVPLVPME